MNTVNTSLAEAKLITLNHTAQELVEKKDDEHRSDRRSCLNAASLTLMRVHTYIFFEVSMESTYVSWNEQYVWRMINTDSHNLG